MPTFSPEPSAAAAALAAAKRSDADTDWRRGALPFLPPQDPPKDRATTESPKTPGLGSRTSSATKSTPDLSGGGGGVGRLGMRVVYTKDYLLKCAGSPLATCSPSNLPHVIKEAPEIIREVPFPSPPPPPPSHPKCVCRRWAATVRRSTSSAWRSSRPPSPPSPPSEPSAPLGTRAALLSPGSYGIGRPQRIS